MQYEDWLENHRWPNGGKLISIQPIATGGPTISIKNDVCGTHFNIKLLKHFIYTIY